MIRVWASGRLDLHVVGRFLGVWVFLVVFVAAIPPFLLFCDAHSVVLVARNMLRKRKKVGL